MSGLRSGRFIVLYSNLALDTYWLYDPGQVTYPQMPQKKKKRKKLRMSLRIERLSLEVNKSDSSIFISGTFPLLFCLLINLHWDSRDHTVGHLGPFLNSLLKEQKAGMSPWLDPEIDIYFSRGKKEQIQL